MEILLLGIYSFFVWLIFIKLKWLPWNITSQVIVVIIPIVGLAAMILLLNIFAPSSADLRVYRFTVPIVSQVKGRVLEVPIEEGNRLVHKGDVLFKIDPTPYQLDVDVLEAQLANAQGTKAELDESLKGSVGKVVESRAAIEQAAARSAELVTKRALAQKRLDQTRELAATGAGSRFDLEQAETNLREIEAQQDSARSAEAQARASVTQAVAGEQQVRQRLGANVKGEFAQVAQIRAQLTQARWLLDQTVTRSPCNCYVINLQLRPGGFVAGLPINPVMTLIEDTGEVVALFGQNELVQVAPGDEAEFALRTHPGRIIKGTVDSVIWAQGQGTMTPSGTVPLSGVLAQPPGRFAVKFDIDERDRAIFLAAGAAGDAAVYTQHLGFLHVIRKVILRVGSYANYIIPKLH